MFVDNFFFWPWLLGLLLCIPLLIWLYHRYVSKTAKSALLHPDLALIAQVEKGRHFKRHLPALFYMGAFIFALLAFARPTMTVPEAHPSAGIVLAMDISRSMQAMDIEPNRFEAAKVALKAFVKNLPEGTRVGLVTFAGYATPVVPLTDNHEQLLEAVDYLRMDFGTVMGDAMLESINTLPSLEERQNLGDDPQRYATVILLTDGRNFGGIDPLEALQEVKNQQVTVHTIGVGTLGDAYIPGIPMEYQFAARFDEKTLRTVAEETDGRFVFVDSAKELSDVYKDLSRTLVWRTGREEVTGFGTLLAALFLFVSLSLAEFRRRVF